MTSELGKNAERLASAWLTRQGLREVMTNYRCRFGEIDLVMQDGQSLVFVEVRARTSHAFGGAAASVTRSKQEKLRKTAWHYLTSKPACRQMDVRFDVLCLDGSPAKMTWLKNAFGA